MPNTTSHRHDALLDPFRATESRRHGSDLYRCSPVLATLIVRSQINQSLLTSIIILPDEQRCINCNSVQNEHLLFSDLRWNCLLFSELAWNITEFRIGFLVASCLFHFGVTIEFSCVPSCLFYP
jgi:hypothetical protein